MSATSETGRSIRCVYASELGYSAVTRRATRDDRNTVSDTRVDILATFTLHNLVPEGTIAAVNPKHGVQL